MTETYQTEEQLASTAAKLRFVWNERNADIGDYDMYVETENGEKLSDSELWLRDYTCDFQKNSPYRDEQKRDIAFEWCWCHGWSHSEEYSLEENLTLEQAKRRAELWIAQKYVDSYESCLKSINRLKPIAAWAATELKKEENL